MMNTNRKRKLGRLYVLFFAILILFEAVVVGRKLSAKTVKPVMGAVNVAPLNLDSEIAVGVPVDYDLEGAIKQLTIMQAKDHRYARIIKDQGKYPEKLLINLANNPELLTFVLGYSQETEYDSSVSLTTEEVKSECPLFLQWDTRWGYQAYGDNNIACSGCGPTALSMVIVGLTHNAFATPAQVADFASRNDYYAMTVGTKWQLMTDGAAAYGLQSAMISTDEATMKQQLDAGKLLIVSMKAGDFTTGGHFIVISGYDENGFQIKDPFCIYRSNQAWTHEKLSTQMAGMWAIGK